MPFDAGDLAALDSTEEIEIETSAPTGPVHRTIIWVVVDQDEAFIRSVRGAKARWYREAVADPNLTIHASGNHPAPRLWRVRLTAMRRCRRTA